MKSKMVKRSVLLSIFLVGAVLVGGFVHPAKATSYNWNFSSLRTLSPLAFDGPAMIYNPHLQKAFMIYPAGTYAPGTVNVLSSTDMISWTNNVDTKALADTGKSGITYNSDDQRMYVVYEYAPCANYGCVNYATMSVISSSDGTQWSSQTNIATDITSYSTGSNNNGPTVVFDSLNHRLLLEYASYKIGDGHNLVYLNQSYGPTNNQVFGQYWSAVSSNPVSYGGSPIHVWATPDLKFINGKLYMAYAADDNSIHVIQSSDGISWSNKVDFPGQSAYMVSIEYNPVESMFHLDYVGFTNPFYIYDNQSPDGISWTGPTRLDGPPPVESKDFPSLAFNPHLNTLSLAWTGTDGNGAFGCPCTDGKLNVIQQAQPVNGAQYIPPSQSQQTGTATATDLQDSYVDQYSPTSNYATSTNLPAMLETACHQCGTVNDLQHSYVQFSLPGLPQGAQITTATLSTYELIAFPSGSVNLQFWAASSSWSESGITWNNAPGGISGSNAAFNGITDCKCTKSFDLTNIVKSWYSGQYSNNGIWVEETNQVGTSTYATFYSKEGSSASAPSITITYTYYTPAPPNIPNTMCNGQIVPVTITMKNTGATVWNPPSSDPSNPYRLGAQSPQDNQNWGFNRVDLSGTVSPGSQYSFSFTVTAPSSPGTYNFQWQMVQDGVTWFGDNTVNVQVTVAACYLSISSNPSSIPADNTATSSISIQTSNNQANVPISISTNLGSLSASTCTTGSSGSCAVTISSYSSGTATVTATVTGYNSASTTVTFTSPDFSLGVQASSVSAPTNSVPADEIYLYSLGGFSGTINLSASISPCIAGSGCSGMTPPTVVWNDTRTTQTSATISSGATVSCGASHYPPCTYRLLIIYAHSGIGEYTITVTGTCVSGSCVSPTQTHSTTIDLWIYVPSGGGGGSVGSGTLITLADGTQIPVQNLQAGMELLSYNMTTHKYATTTITEFVTVVTYNQIVISTGTGKPLIVDQNPAQELYVKLPDGTLTLIPVTELKVDYSLFDALSQTWVPITGIHYENGGRHTMYDIYTTAPGNYIANGYLDPLKE